MTLNEYEADILARWEGDRRDRANSSHVTMRTLNNAERLLLRDLRIENSRLRAKVARLEKKQARRRTPKK